LQIKCEVAVAQTDQQSVRNAAQIGFRAAAPD
jgi:hypothetical protein